MFHRIGDRYGWIKERMMDYYVSEVGRSHGIDFRRFGYIYGFRLYRNDSSLEAHIDKTLIRTFFSFISHVD